VSEDGKGTSFRLFKNGRIIADETIDSPRYKLLRGNSFLGFSNESAGEDFTGYIDEVSVWSGMAGEDDAKRIMYHGRRIPALKNVIPLAYLSMDNLSFDISASEINVAQISRPLVSIPFVFAWNSAQPLDIPIYGSSEVEKITLFSPPEKGNLSQNSSAISIGEVIEFDRERGSSLVFIYF